MSEQDPSLRSGYDRAWRCRIERVAALRAEGLEDPYVLIQKLQRFEEGHYLTQSFTYEPRPFEGERLPTGKPVFRRLPVRGETVPVPFYRDGVEFLLDWLEQHRYDAIAELGAGYGRNLFELLYRGGPKVIPYYAAELSESGRALARTLAAQRPDLPLHVVDFDYLEPDLSFLLGYDRVLVFTMHSIEQVTRIPESLLPTIRAAAPHVTAVHFEPFGFQIEEIPGPVCPEHRDATLARKWNVNLGEALIGSHNRGEIRLRYMAANIFGGALDNPTSFAMWETP